MSGRFSIVPILRGHWKGLTVGTQHNVKPDWLARAVLVVPVAVALLAYACGARVAAPGPLLSGVSLLAGGLLMVFTQISSWRMKLRNVDVDATDRDMIDETVAHVLMAALICALDAIVLIIGMNSDSENKYTMVTGVYAALAIGLSAYIALLFILTLPRLYAAYTHLNKVGPHLSGYSRGKW